MIQGDWTTYLTSDIPVQQGYQFLVRIVAPRPIALVSTVSSDGAPNLAPFSFFMGGGANPPSVCFSVATPRSHGDKHTLANIKSTGQYCINVVTREITEKVNLTSAELAHGESEWELSGLTKRPARLIQPCLVAESPLGMECKLYEIVKHGTGMASANYVIGEVVCFHIHDSVEANGTIDQSLVDYVGRLGGDTYASTSGVRFEYERP